MDDFVLKTETNPAGLILCICLLHIGTGVRLDFADPPTGGFTAGWQPDGSIATAVSYLRSPGLHFFSHTDFHRRAIERQFGYLISADQFTDTCETARLMFGHQSNKLSDWATRLGKRGGGKALLLPFWTTATMRRCMLDAEVVAALVKHMTKAAEQRVSA